MRSDVKSDPGYAYRWLPIVFAALALGGLFILVLLQPEPVYGTVLSVREGNDGEMYATVEYVDPQSGETVVDSLLFPLQHLDAETVPVWPGNGGNQPQIGAFGRVELTPTLAVSVAGIAALLGFVVQFTVRGFGYVPGTGKPGQTNPTEVAEDRGFYWRT